MGMRVWSGIVALGMFATAVWAPAAIAQRGEGAAPAAQGGGQQAPARGGGRGAGRGAPQVPAGPIPRLANGKPDLSGLWNNPYTPDMGRGAVDPMTREALMFARKGEPLPDERPRASGGNAPREYDLPYTDWGLKEWKEYDPVKNGDYAGSCL